ncbi:MAG TPA: CBS domain-containing protein [Lacibacter sp.]|nr:CBS domain-containing protein [Lacibacter sp.]HMO88493.1 CBS domain-containing protein [Lacibacter sp.]HMP87041.1 CBS domain-containing protein [Lacibacter sp.]
MTAADIISNDLPVLQMTDTAAQALQYMEDNEVTELPLLNDNKLVGLLRRDDLGELRPATPLHQCLDQADASLVRPTDFFLVPLKLMHQRRLSMVPVVNDGRDFLGLVRAQDLLHTVASYNAAAEPGGVIILQMTPTHFSISEIGRIVESNDAKIIHLNTWTEPRSGLLMVAIKVNKNDIHDILASLERYEYEVVHYFGENLSEEELRLNFDHLMNYLNI